jgi:hypothetical protein
LGEFVKGRYIRLFEEELMVNRLIKAYLKKSENREYTQQLFGKLFEKVMDMPKFIRDLRGRKQGDIPTQVSTGSDGPGFDDKPYDSILDLPMSPSTRFIEDHFTNQLPKFEIKVVPVTVEEDVKAPSEQPSRKLNTEDVLLVCDHILEMITKKLLYMPLSIRYLCKMLERLAEPHVHLI